MKIRLGYANIQQQLAVPSGIRISENEQLWRLGFRELGRDSNTSTTQRLSSAAQVLASSRHAREVALVADLRRPVAVDPAAGRKRHPLQPVRRLHDTEDPQNATEASRLGHETNRARVNLQQELQFMCTQLEVMNLLTGQGCQFRGIGQTRPTLLSTVEARETGTRRSRTFLQE